MRYESLDFEDGGALGIGPTSEQLEALEEIGKDGLGGLAEVLRKEGLEAVRHLLWEATGWHRHYALVLAHGSERTTNEHKRSGWKMFVRMEKIPVTVLHEALRQRVEETMVTSLKGQRAFTDNTEPG